MCRGTFEGASRVPIPFRTSRRNVGLLLRRCMIVFSKKSYLDDSNTKQECLYASCKQAARFTYLHHSMMDGCVLFLLQHHQGDNDHCRYDNTAHHEPNDGTFVGTHIFCKEHLENKSRKRIVTTGDVWMRNVKSFSISSLHFMP